MANFKSLNAKQKDYAFDFFDNKSDPKPARVIFKRFPLPGESFIKKSTSSIFKDVDFKKIQGRDEAELERLTDSFMAFYVENAQKIDFERFAEECIDHFEDFFFDGVEIKTAADFAALPIEPRTIIVNDCHAYASRPDTFTVGESPA